MATITVGKQYEKEFRSIAKLYENGFLSEKVHIQGVERDDYTQVAYKIVTTEHVYVLGSEESTTSKQLHRYDDSGASWFAAFRGEPVDDNNSAWVNFINEVGSDYRENYAFIEFEQVKTDEQIRKESVLVDKLVQLLGNFYYRLSRPYPMGDDMDKTVNIYCLSIKLYVSAGAGQTKPVQGKMYFKKTADPNNPFEPVDKEQAFDIEKLITNAVADDKEGAPLEFRTEDRELLEKVFVAMAKRIEDTKGEEDNDFTDYVILSGETKGSNIIVEANAPNETGTDFKTVRTMLKNKGTDKTINCSKMEILGVSHVKWENSFFKVKQNDRDVLSVVVGMNDTIDVRCLNCSGDDAVLIETGIIRGTVEGEEKLWRLDPNKDNFGLSEQDIESIKMYSSFSKHLLTVDCSRHTVDGCRRTVCQSQSTLLDGERKCNNCRHPEIVYTDIFDESSKPIRTQNARFVIDRLTLVEGGVGADVYTCSCCGRTYTTRLTNGKCKYCSTTDSGAEGTRKYKLYRKMLSPTTRLFHLFSKKSCREYRGMIIFTLGSDKYVFDCLSANERGLIKGPIKYKRSKK